MRCGGVRTPATCEMDSADAQAFLKLIRYAELHPDGSDGV